MDLEPFMVKSHMISILHVSTSVIIC